MGVSRTVLNDLNIIAVSPCLIGISKQGMEYVTYSRRRVGRMLSTKQIITNIILPWKFQRILQVELVVTLGGNSKAYQWMVGLHAAPCLVHRSCD